LPLVLSEHQDPRFPARIGTFDPHERLVAFQGATRLHLLTDSFLDTLPAHLRARARVIPNTVPPTSNIADPGGNAKHAKVLLAVARLVERKNLRRLLHEFAKVAPKHPDWILRIVGGGPLREDLESLARQLDLGAQVSFTGEINDVYGALAKAQCFVLPSLFEGFPMSSLEAMAHGLPVIGYAACNGLNTQVKHELNGLLAAPALASDSLSRELDRVMSNAKLRRNMGTASLERYRTLYSNEVVFDQWEALFMEAADQPRHSRIPLEDRLEAALDRAVFGDF
ncbi:MAG: glycosyltransferase, partial [Pseudomonadota bacterium]